MKTTPSINEGKLLSLPDNIICPGGFSNVVKALVSIEHTAIFWMRYEPVRKLEQETLFPEVLQMNCKVARQQEAAAHQA